jgi:hypothetical protein
VRRPTARGCAGAFTAVAVAAAAMILPRTMGESPALPRIETFISSACGGSSPCPSPERLEGLRRLETMLAERMPGLPESDRTRLADVIYEEAHAASLDPFFVLAVIAVESGFDRGAESDRGARGLMQLRPATLRREAERSQLEAADPDDPVLNVRAGVRYLRRLLRAFGSTDLALMAYNAGPNRILRYLQDDGEVPERFLTYPQRVNGELRRLRRRHAATPLALVERAPAVRRAPRAPADVGAGADPAAVR